MERIMSDGDFTYFKYMQSFKLIAAVNRNSNVPHFPQHMGHYLLNHHNKLYYVRNFRRYE